MYAALRGNERFIYVFHKYVGVVTISDNMESYQFSKRKNTQNVCNANVDMFIVDIFFIITGYK